MKTPVTDEELLKRAGQGRDKQAFEILCDRYAVPIFAMARRMGLAAPDAEDAVQNMLVKLWQKAHLWDQSKGAGAKTWIYQISYNVIIDVHRKNRGFFGLISDGMPTENAVDNTPKDANLSQKDLVRKGLKDIPERQRSALIMFYYEGLSTQDIADIQKTTPKAIERLLARARENFKNNLQRLEVSHV